MSGGIGHPCDGSGHSAGPARRWSCLPSSRWPTQPEMAPPLKIALVQMRVERRPGREPRARAREDRRRGAAGRARRVPARALPLALLLPERGPRATSTSPSRSRAQSTEALAQARREARDRDRRLALRAARRGRLPQHRGGARRGRPRRSGCTARCTSRTTRSTTRSSTSRPATSASARSRRGPRRIGTLVCWDQWFPEAARLDGARAARRSSSTRPRSAGSSTRATAVDTAQHDAWETVQRAHAIANGVFVAAANRVGREDGVRFWGQSFVADPFGRVLARRGDARRRSLVVDCDLGAIEAVRRNWPFLRDRRIDAYDGEHPTKRDVPRSLRSARDAGPRSGSRTARPGSRGRTTPTTWPGCLAERRARVRRDRARARRAASACSILVARRAHGGGARARCSRRRASTPTAGVSFYAHPDQRRLGARPRPDLRRARRRDARAARARLRLQRVGRQVSAVRSRRRDPRADRRRSRRRACASRLRARGRLDRRRRRGHGAHHRDVPAESEPRSPARRRATQMEQRLAALARRAHA